MINLFGGYGFANSHDVRDALAMQNAYHQMVEAQRNIEAMRAQGAYDQFGFNRLANLWREPEIPDGWRDWYAIGDQLH